VKNAIARIKGISDWSKGKTLFSLIYIDKKVEAKAIKGHKNFK